MGKAHVESRDIRCMSALPDAHSQAVVLGGYAPMRAVLAGNCHCRLSQEQPSRKPRSASRKPRSAALSPMLYQLKTGERKTTPRGICAELANARTAPHGAIKATQLLLRCAGLFLRYSATAFECAHSPRKYH